MAKRKIIAEFFNDAQAVAGLSYSLHSFCGAKERWDKLRLHGASDEEIMKQVGYEFGIQGGIAGPGIYSSEHRGGVNPKFQCWTDESIEKALEGTIPNQDCSDAEIRPWKKPTPLFNLYGADLIRIVRKLLGIPEIEPSLFEAEALTSAILEEYA